MITTEQIRTARLIADELIDTHGQTTGARVYEEMEARGLVDTTIKRYWLGLIFRHPKYQRTGQIQQGLGHDTLSNVWEHA